MTDESVTELSPFALNPWHPMTDAVDVKHLGKLGEECCELGSAIARCIIQGIDEFEPVTGKPNREWLENEIADVLAGIELNIQHFGLDRHAILERREHKIKHLRAWHAMA